MTALLTWRGLQEYARRPLNLVLLVVVPMVFVTLSAGTLADFSAALGASARAGAIEAASAGWAAAILAGIAGFFHVTGSREPDRRLAAAGGAGSGTWPVVLARMWSALGLAAVASLGALGALALRTGLPDPVRTIGATVLFAVTYLAVGMTVGALLRSEMNGSLLIVFLWIFDVFLSPAMGVDAPALRLLPLHYPAQVITAVTSGHAGPVGDLGISLAWATGGLAVAVLALVATTRPARTTPARPPGALARLRGGLRYGFREYRRNVALWVLLVGLPIYFITVSIAVTPDDPAPLTVTEAGQQVTRMLPMSQLHGAIMVPITVAFLAGLAGLFVVTGSAQADHRLVVAGFRPWEVLIARLGTITFAALLTTTVALLVTATSFSPLSWSIFATSNLLVALTYGMLGVLAGALVGRLGGMYLMLMLPFIDLGIAQNPMFDAAPPEWANLLPAYGSVRVLLDGAFTATLDQPVALMVGLGWLAAISLAAAAVFRRLAAPTRA
jgi:hypothetical protein